MTENNTQTKQNHKIIKELTDILNHYETTQQQHEKQIKQLTEELNKIKGEYKKITGRI